ncbi:MAG: DUF3783 domain-containing protein, partial [Lachnospiraceae bacterium]|nr:DUF3783 domain-containing protein [Lachnospiraceae bacterium]
ILYYVQDEKKKIQMEVLGMSMSITTKQLKPSDLNTQVGALVGLKNITPLDLSQVEKAPAIFYMPEIIIFSGIPNKMLDEFLFSYKKVGLTPTKLKAVITPKNVNWTLYQLIRELSSERAQIEGMAKLSTARLSTAKLSTARLSTAKGLSEAKKERE